MRFADRTAWVTGSSRGIGKATAIKLAEQGADIAVHCHHNRQDADAVCKQVRALGRRALCVQGDVAEPDDVAKMVSTIEADLGPIQLLVNNAGYVGDRPFAEIDHAHWQRVLAVNLTGSFNTIWAVKDSMSAAGFGRIVNVASIAALAVRPEQMPYAAAKAGVISLTKSCCGPLAKDNIRINGVAPGAIETDMLAEISPDMVAKLCADTPLARLGQPEEMADVIVFLLSEESSFMTGATVIASGGRLLMP